MALGGVVLLLGVAARAQTITQHQVKPPDDPRGVFEQAQRALASGDYPGAERGFRKVLQLDPGSAAAYVNLGVVYMRTVRFDDAIRAFQTAKKLDPQMVGIDLNLGLAYYRKQDFAQAIPHFARVLAADPGNAQAHHLKGMCHFLLDEYEPAVEALEPILPQEQDDLDLDRKSVV